MFLRSYSSNLRVAKVLGRIFDLIYIKQPTTWLWIGRATFGTVIIAAQYIFAYNIIRTIRGARATEEDHGALPTEEMPANPAPATRGWESPPRRALRRERETRAGPIP